MPQAVTVTPEEREAIERVSLLVLVFYLLFKKKKSIALELMIGKEFCYCLCIVAVVGNDQKFIRFDA